MLYESTLPVCHRSTCYRIVDTHTLQGLPVSCSFGLFESSPPPPPSYAAAIVVVVVIVACRGVAYATGIYTPTQT